MKTRLNRAFLIAAVVLIASNLFLFYQIFFQKETAGSFDKVFPSTFEGWTSTAVIYDEAIMSVLSPDKVVYRTYSKNNNQPISLLLLCYNNLEKADFSHSPVVCFTGQGWDIVGTDEIKIPVEYDGIATIIVNRIFQKKEKNKMITLYWYQSAKNSYANRGIQKLSLFSQKILGHSERNAFVRIIIDVPDEKLWESLMPEIELFVKELYPELRRFVN